MERLLKTDIVNMMCGLPFGFYAMEKAQEHYGKDICTYNDRTGEFKWYREIINKMQLDDIINLYDQVKKWNKEETAKKNKKIILNTVIEKRCYFKCSVCGYDRVAGEDKYCSACGAQFNEAE